jgi:phospholipid/cholesterol/gamma-HCH transport system substrate-binding protein
MTAIQGRKVAGPLVKLTVFAAVTLLLTAMLAETLGSLDFAGGVTYRARFTDVTGVLPGDDVRIAGVRVGQVKKIRVVNTEGPAARGGAVAELAFTVDSDVPLATSVRATIRYRNLVGQRYVALTEGPGNGPGGQRLQPNGLVPLAQTAPALDLTVLFNGFRPLFTALSPGDVNRLAYEVIQVFQGEGGTVASLLRRTASLANTLADRDAVIGRVVSNLNAVLATVDARDRQFSETIRELQLFVSGLAADRTAIGEALSSISGLADATAGLLRDARPSLASDIDSLGKLASNLNDNSTVIENTLGRLPGRYDALVRTASYGSWFNFFLCDFDGSVGVGPASVNAVSSTSGAARCAGSGDAR